MISRSRLLSLDALRGVAAITVLFHHIEREFSIRLGFTYGYLAVDFFFLMSGFVIAGAYEPRMDERMGLGSFLFIRLKRLYPMIFLGAILGIAAGIYRHYDDETLFLGGLSVMSILPLLWSGNVLFPLNIPEWSLFYEVCANLAHRILRPVLSTWVVVLCVALSVAGMGLAAWKLHALANGWSPGTFWGGFPRVFFSYFLGVLIYRVTDKVRMRWPVLPLPALMLAFVSVVVLEAVVGRRVMPSLYWLIVISTVFPALFLLLVNAHVPRRFAAIASGLGDLSFPLYAVHVPLLIFAAPLVEQFNGTDRYLAAFMAAVGIILTALMLDMVYDRPIRRLLAGPRPPRALDAETQIAAP